MMEETDSIDFTLKDELSSLTVVVENHHLYVHKEILAAWSPVFRSMFTRDSKEKEKEQEDIKEIKLYDKKIEDVIELLYCIYPPIKPINDANVYQLLPLAEEYKMTEVKRKCEEFLINKPGNMELLVTAQTYGLQQLLMKCIEQVRRKSFTDLQKDPLYGSVHPKNLIHILQLRVLDLESSIDENRKITNERDNHIFGIISDLASCYGNFCSDCKSRKVSDTCYGCLKMFREKVKSKCEEAKVYRNQNPPFSKET